MCAFVCACVCVSPTLTECSSESVPWYTAWCSLDLISFSAEANEMRHFDTSCQIKSK